VGWFGVAGALVTVSWLPDPESREYWNDLKALLLPAAQRGRCEVFEPDDLVWIAIDGRSIIGAATTRLVEGNEVEVKHIAGSRFSEWGDELDDMLTEWAKACGAKRMVSRGRQGWARVSRKWGWHVSGSEDGLTLYEKDL
jgi:hypothetical protein